MQLTSYQKAAGLPVAKEGSSTDTEPSLQEKWVVTLVELNNLVQTKNRLLRYLASLNHDIDVLIRIKQKLRAELANIGIPSPPTFKDLAEEARQIHGASFRGRR